MQEDEGPWKPWNEEAIRFRLWDASASEGPDGITVEFSIPKGCYATSVLREIMKVDAA